MDKWTELLTTNHIREAVWYGHLSSALSGKFTIPSPEGIHILLYFDYPQTTVVRELYTYLFENYEMLVV